MRRRVQTGKEENLENEEMMMSGGGDDDGGGAHDYYDMKVVLVIT